MDLWRTKTDKTLSRVDTQHARYATTALIRQAPERIWRYTARHADRVPRRCRHSLPGPQHGHFILV